MCSSDLDEVLRAKHSNHILHRLIEQDMMIYIATVWVILRPNLGTPWRIVLIILSGMAMAFQWIKF